MNNLNSIVFEGKITGKPDFIENKAIFFVESSRFYKNAEGEEITEKTLIQCKLTFNYPSHVSKLKDGRGVRLVGRLSNYGDKVIIIVEHLEYKPEYKKTTNWQKIKQNTGDFIPRMLIPFREVNTMEKSIINFFDELKRITYVYEKENNYNIVFCPSYDCSTGIYTVEIKKTVSFYDYKTLKVISSTSQADILELVKNEVEGWQYERINY